MEILAAIPIIMALLFWPWLTGVIAKTYGRKFWAWFFIGILLPFIAIVILFCLPEKIIRSNKRAIKSITLKKIKNVKT